MSEVTNMHHVHVLDDKFDINNVTLQPEIDGYCNDDSLVSQDEKLK